MCNFFACALFIALLTALLAGDGVKTKNPEAKSDTEELMEEQIKRFLHDKEKIIDILKTNQEKERNLTSQITPQMLRELSSLESKNTTLQEKYDTLAEEVTAPADIQSIQEKLKQDLEKQRQQSVKIDNINKSLENEINRLNSRLLALDEQIKKLSENKVRIVRFPRETQDQSRVWEYVIVKEGEMFPVYKQGHVYNLKYVSVETRNETPIGLSTRDIIHPISGSGITGNTDARKYLGQLNNLIQYPVFLVYPDSFPEFLNFKELAIEEALDYGLQFIETNDNVILSIHGEKRGTQ
jgi:uncharacterized phage infection (PIP) family protein YhgE